LEEVSRTCFFQCPPGYYNVEKNDPDFNKTVNTCQKCGIDHCLVCYKDQSGGPWCTECLHSGPNKYYLKDGKCH
jgi:hypothetical protein